LGGKRVGFTPLPGPLVDAPLNLFLLEQAADRIEWSAKDPRTIHLRNTLKVKNGDLVDFGVVNGPKGKGRVSWQNSGEVEIFLDWKTPHPSDLIPLSILVGLSRPQTCRKIIEQGSTLGVSQILFFPTEKGEVSYTKSSLWDEEWRRLLVKGAEQAFSCHLPVCEKVSCLEEAIEKSASIHSLRLALDVYEANRALAEVKPAVGQPLQLAIGPERGWSDAERKQLRKLDFELCHMGTRVLRVETAMVASVGCLAEAFWALT